MFLLSTYIDCELQIYQYLNFITRQEFIFSITVFVCFIFQNSCLEIKVRNYCFILFSYIVYGCISYTVYNCIRYIVYNCISCIVYKYISCIKYNSINSNIYTASAAESVAELTVAANSNSVESASKRKADVCKIYIRNNSKRANKIDNNNNLNNK